MTKDNASAAPTQGGVMVDLRLGDWRECMSDVIADVGCDLLLTDPPFSARAHDGQLSHPRADHGAPTDIHYGSIDEAYCRDFVSAWLPAVRFWWVVFGDHISVRWWLDAFDEAGLYAFAPVVWAKRAAPPRLTGDGPASQVEYIAVARPKRAGCMGWGSLPGWYEARCVNATTPEALHHPGQKPETLIRALVRDYSRPGDVVCDPHAGTATTLVAARAEGREAYGCERDPATYAKAAARIARPRTRELFAPVQATAGGAE